MVYTVFLVVCVCLFCMRYFCSLSLPLGVRAWLRLVIVAIPGPFYLTFFKTLHGYNFSVYLCVVNDFMMSVHT